MKRIVLILLFLLPLATGCYESSLPVNSGAEKSVTEEELVTAAEAEFPAATRSLAENLESLSAEGNAENETLMDEVTRSLGKLDLTDEETVAEVTEKLNELNSAPKTRALSDIFFKNDVLKKFASWLATLMVAAEGTETNGSEPETIALSHLKAMGVRVIVSDGITRKGASGTAEEILPNAFVYAIPEGADAALLNYIFAVRVKEAPVQFYCRDRRLGILGIWHKLGDPVVTDDSGKATLPKLAERIPSLCFPNFFSRSSVDLDLRAEVVLNDTPLVGAKVDDEKGMIRVLSDYEEKNSDVILTDHDNTLHETGGGNALQDILDAVNVLKKEWPFVDYDVEKEVKAWLSEGNEMIIISGMTPHMRDKTRNQMQAHFTGDEREVPIIVKEDTTHGESNIFKAETISILKNLYGNSDGGNTHIRAMVGDTARQDGYGALANDVLYVPFQIHYAYRPDLLDTEGFGEIDTATIAWNWNEVMQLVKTGKITARNFWQSRNHFLNVAHRGGGKLAPEDTLVAYRNAVAVGADTLEGDCHLTSDGTLVVSHDDTVDRCTNGSGAIAGMTLAEILALDAGYEYTADNGKTYPYRGQGIKLPTVREVFELLTEELTETPMILEVKSKENRDLAIETLFDLIEEFDGGSGLLMNRLLLGAFNQESIDLLKERAAARGLDAVRCFSTEGVLKFLVTPTFVQEREDYIQPGEVLCLPWALVTPGVMDRARKLGLPVHVWTVNTSFMMKWMKNTMKVDGVMTDDPALLAEVIAGQ